MSLDVYLFVADVSGGPEVEVFEANITHNLSPMAREAGIYGAVWRPDENGIETAGGVAAALRLGLPLLRADPERFRALNSSNGWGLYENFVPWLEQYLAACEQYPAARVEVWR